MGRDPLCPPTPDSRGNPGAVLCKNQKIVTVETIPLPLMLPVASSHVSLTAAPARNVRRRFSKGLAWSGAWWIFGYS